MSDARRWLAAALLLSGGSPPIGGSPSSGGGGASPGGSGAGGLQGGVSPNIDPCSSITRGTPAGGAASVAFAEPGTYPFFCNFHADTMRGAIYVEP